MVIPAALTHGLRVFAADLTPDDAARIQGQAGLLAGLLGVPQVDPAQIALFHTDDIDAVGLVDYLLDGGGVTPAQIDAGRASLAACRGYVLTVRDAAFPTRPITLRPDPRLRLLGAYAEDTSPIRFEDLPDGATTNAIPIRPPMSDARIGGMVATAALIFLFALTALVIWIAG